MDFSSPEKAAAIAERAYFIYLKRVEQGLPGDEDNDWYQAVAENEAPPAPPLGAKTAEERNEKPGPREVLRKAATVNQITQKQSVKKSSPVTDLSKIKGIGPKAIEAFHKCGIRCCSDLAAWKITDIDKHLPRFSNRARKDRWLAQARKLASS